MTVGDRIRTIRESKGISQEELSRILGLKDKSSVCKIEKAGDNISTRSIKKYAKALGVSISDIMGWTDHEDPSLQLQLFADNDEAMQLYQNYMNAPANIQAAVRALLGSDAQDP